MENLEFGFGAKLAIAILLGLIIAGAAYAAITSTLVIPNVGTVTTVGVEAYWDVNATNPVEQIDWGTCDPGAIYNKTIYIKNSGNSPCTLSIEVQDWNPENASNYIVLAWNYTNQVINPNEIIPIQFVLAISDEISGIEQFSFNLVITASEVGS